VKVAEYVAGLPEDRRATVAKLRALLNRRMPKGYCEGMSFGAIAWSIPLETFPDTYNGQPLCYTALASRKNYYSLYLMGAYGSAAERRKLEEGFRRAGKKLDMGKSCVRFRSLDDLPLEVIGDSIAGLPPARYIAQCRAALAGATRSGTTRARPTRSGTKSAAKKAKG
jgi:hypothetical protein